MAFVLSSLSGNLISAASAGFAPTNSADVSAIASAYQVVSSTATQLNAGTAYLTSVNETPISASRAGNAANASLANSAWYDGTGRLISALPDEATVSSIASAYAESAASSKLDESATADFYPTSNPSGFISGVDLSDYATTAYVDSSISSFVDSAYVESQVSGKQDASAMSAYALSADVSGVIDTVSSNSASWAGGITGDYLTSKVGSGQATFSTAFQDGMEKRPSLVIAAERTAGAKMYPRMMVTDWNDTTGDTHSGMLLANAFEFYTCPQSARGEVNPSGLVQSRLDASHLQFNIDSAVSSFTRSAEFTRSGMRLGMSANTASWVTISGNSYSGGFVTLDDGSSTSGRIVASSIGYWNGKLDSSAATGFVDSAYVESQVSGVIDTVSANSASWGGGGGGGVNSATVSAIASSYAESAASSKQDTLTFDWDSNSAISSINGSALAGGGGASIPFTGNYYDSAASATVVITADVSSVGSVSYQKYNGNFVNTYSGITDTLGNIHLGVASFMSPGAEINGKNNGGIPYTLSFAPASSMWTTAGAATGIFSPLQYGTGAGMFMDSNYFKGYLKGNEWFVSDDRYGYARGEVHNSRGCRVIVEHTAGAGAVLSAKNKEANVTLNNTSYCTAKMAIANSQAYVQVQRGNSASKYNSAKLDTDYLKFYNGMTTGYLDPEDTASGTAYMPAETEFMYISSIPYWNGKLDASAIECDTASAITAIGGSAIAGGGGGGVVTSIDETYPSTGGTFISRINETYIYAVTADSASAWVGASSKVDQSAYDNLYSAFTALNDLISQYSAYFSSISSKVDNSAIGVTE